MIALRRCWTIALFIAAALLLHCGSALAVDASGNIHLDVPTQIQFRASATGQLITPTPSSMRISNHSGFEVCISSVKFTPAEDWNVVSDAYDSTLPNSVSISIGPSGSEEDLSRCVGASRAVGNDIAWTMADESVSLPLASIDLTAKGEIANIKSSRGGETIGSIEWHVASDTVTNQILDRISALENENAQLRAQLDEKADKDAAISNIERDGNTFTATRTDGTSFTFDQKDDDTTYSAGSGLSLSGNVFSNAGATGVKGNAESAFRTGDVNLTAENVGALGTYRWEAVTRGQTWSRILSCKAVVTTIGCSGILSISCTRSNVVVNASFYVCSSHPSYLVVNNLGSPQYSSVRVRGTVNNTGDFTFEIYDTNHSIASGTEQKWHCVYTPLLRQDVTPITTFTNATTPLSGYTAKNDFTTTIGDASSPIVSITTSGSTHTATRANGSTFTF